MTESSTSSTEWICHQLDFLTYAFEGSERYRGPTMREVTSSLNLIELKVWVQYTNRQRWETPDKYW
jgi:hypothetical protein